MSLADGVYKIVNASARVVATSGTVSGAKVTGSNDTGALNQQWTLTSKGGGTYFLTAVDPDLSASARPPALAGQEIVSSSSPTKWNILSTTGGKYTIGVAANNLVWQLQSTSSGTPVNLGPNSGSDTQKWTFQPMQ